MYALPDQALRSFPFRFVGLFLSINCVIYLGAYAITPRSTCKCKYLNEEMRSKVAIHSRAQAVSEFITIEHQDLNEAIEEANHGASKLLFPKRQSRIRVFRHEYLVVFVYPGEDGKCVLFDDEKRADFVSHLRAEELVPIALDPDDIIAVYDKFGSLDLYEILWLHSGTSDWVRKP